MQNFHLFIKKHPICGVHPLTHPFLSIPLLTATTNSHSSDLKQSVQFSCYSTCSAPWSIPVCLCSNSSSRSRLSVCINTATAHSQSDQRSQTSTKEWCYHLSNTKNLIQLLLHMHLSKIFQDTDGDLDCHHCLTGWLLSHNHLSQFISSILTLRDLADFAPH